MIRRTAEIEILPAVEHFGMSMTVWQPLAGAMLCGSEDELNRRIAAGYPKPNEAQMKIIRAVNEVAEETGRSVPQVALNWLRQQSPAIIPIIGVRLPEHVIDNVACLDWTLTEDQIDRLNAAQTLTTIYPYDQLTASINYFIYNFMPKQAFDTHRFPRWIK